MSENELIGTIYSYLLEEFGFGYIDKDLWMIAENLSEKIANEQPQLNENQQIVLEWLKNLYGCHYYQPFVAVSLFRHSFWTEKIEENYNQLDRKQQAQVLEVFSRWVQEQEEE